jgi:hypothetical protein
MNEKKLYLVSVYAQRINMFSAMIEIHHAALVVKASNKEEAIGIGIRSLENRKPHNQGWGNYDIVAVGYIEEN